MNIPKCYLNPSIIEERKLNVAQMDVFSRLMMDRNIFIGDEITDELANIVIAQMLFLDSVNNDPITIYLNTPGGDVYSGLAIYDTSLLIKSKINTVCIGMCASMGAILLMVGKSRKTLKHSRIMLHQPSGGAFGTARDIEIVNEEIQKTKKDLYNIIKDRTNIKNPEEFCRDDRWINSIEAKELGIVTEIL